MISVQHLLPSYSLSLVGGLSLRRSRGSSLIKLDDSAHYRALTLVLLLQSEVEEKTRGGGGGRLFATAEKLHDDNHHSLAFHFPGKLSARQRERHRRKIQTINTM